MTQNSTQLLRQFPHRCLLLATGISALLLTACASTGEAKKHPVEDRAQQRWDALLVEDLDTAYGLYSPGFRSANSRVNFEISHRMRKVKPVAVKVESSDCSADACTVAAAVMYQAGAAIPGVSRWESSSMVQERWVRTEGDWWYVPEQ